MTIGSEILYLTKSDVIAADLDMKTCIDLIEEAFLARAQGTVTMPHKLTVQPDSHLQLLGMGASISPECGTGIKWLASSTTNTASGLPRFTGLIILNDYETGMPVCIMDAEYITAMRTAAVSGLGIRYLANRNASVVGVLGTGVEGKSNLIAAVTERPSIHTVLVYDRRAHDSQNTFAQPGSLKPSAAQAETPAQNPSKTDTPAQLYVSEMQALYPGLTFHILDDPEAVVRGADILLLSCPSTHGDAYRIIRREWLKDGVTAVPVSQDSLFTNEAMPAFDLLFTDDAESYEVRKNLGHFKLVPDTPPELGDLITDLKAAEVLAERMVQDPANAVDCKIRRLMGRTDAGQKALLITAGLAMEDITTANWVYHQALKQELGTRLPR